MAGKKTQAQLTPEEKLQQALVPEAEQPYKVPANWCWTRQNIACYLSDIEKIVNGEHPYLEAKFLRGLKKPKIVSAGKFINKSSKVILVDGENSGEVFDIFVDGYMGSTFRLLCFSEIVYEQYCRYFIIINKEIYSKSKKGSAIPHLNKELFFNMPFPLPPLTEQQRIVERIESLFAKLDEAKENLQNVLDGFETRKAAILHKAFTGELTANWRKQHGVSMESWVITTLKDVCLKITDGTHNSPVNTPIGEYMYITAKNIKETGVDLSNITFVSKDVHNEIYSRCDVQYGDVLYIKDGATTGIATVNNIEIPFSLLSSVAVLRPNKKIILAKYMAYNLNSSEVKSMMINNMSGNAITRLTLTKIKAAIIKICSLEEQAEIVRIIDDLLVKEQQAKKLAENALAKIDLIKKSILARAFRGKLGTNNLADEPAVELLKQML